MKILEANLLGRWRFFAVDDEEIQGIIATVESPSIYMVKRYDQPFKPEVLTIWGIGDTAKEALERGQISQDRINSLVYLD
jgi:hypothetical protein